MRAIGERLLFGRLSGKVKGVCGRDVFGSGRNRVVAVGRSRAGREGGCGIVLSETVGKDDVGDLGRRRLRLGEGGIELERRRIEA